MPVNLPRRPIRFLTAGATVLTLWAAGALFVALPIGDGLLRLSYDCLYLFARQQADPNVVIVALNEETDRALGRKQGEPFSRRHHARLVKRLTEAGCERICYDILFDLPSSDPSADEEFRQEIASHGRVILGGALDHSRQESIAQSRIFPPHESLREVAEDWGTLNVEPIDPDGTIRRFPAGHELGKPLALAAADALAPERGGIVPGTDAWLQYTAPPGQIPLYELSACLDPTALPDRLFRGKTVFVGGNYSTDAIGSRDVYRTPYSRFGAPQMSGVEWHANAYLNARDQLWFRSASLTRSLLWCLPLALLGIPIMMNRRPWLNTGILLLLAMGVSLAAISSVWNSHLLIPWLVPVVIQVPAALVLQLSHSLLAPRVRYLAPTMDPGQFENLAVFISFATPDRRRAEDLCRLLNDNGRKAWMCTEHIPAGSDWPSHLSTAIENCQTLVFLMSQHSLKSTFCESELNLAMTLKKAVLTVALDDSAIPNRFRIFMGMRQIIDGSSQSDEAVMQHLLTGVTEAIDTADGAED